MSETLMKEMDNDSDGSITVEELTDAFLLRQETLTTLLVNKVTANTSWLRFQFWFCFWF